MILAASLQIVCLRDFRIIITMKTHYNNVVAELLQFTTFFSYISDFSNSNEVGVKF